MGVDFYRNDPIPPNYSEFIEEFSASVADDGATDSFTLTKGSNNRIVRDIFVYITGAGNAARVQVHRTDGSPAAGDKIGGVYYNATSVIAINEISGNNDTTALKLVTHSGNGTQTMYIAVRYWYK